MSQDNSQYRRKGGWDNGPMQEKARRQNARQKKWKLLINGMKMIKGTELDLMTEEDYGKDNNSM